MHLMFCDETNLTETEHQQFFIYGGLIVNADKIASLGYTIAALREDDGFTPDDSLKFQGRSKPKHIDREAWNHTKEAVLHACRQHGAWFVACVVLHAIAKKKKDRLIPWQLDHVLKRFQTFLEAEDDSGFVVIDRIGQQQEYRLIADRFRHGGKPWGQAATFDRISGYAATADGATHLASAADIVLGTFTYCVNQRGDLDVPKQLFHLVRPLLWPGPSKKNPRPLHWGVIEVPAQVKYLPYLKQYTELRRHLESLENRAEG